MRQCILHIGMNKTGTTSLQAAFYRFESDRLICPDLGAANQSVALVNAFHSHPEIYLFNRIHGIPSAQIAAQRVEVRKQLTQALQDHRDILLSGEGMSNALPAEDVPRLVKFLRDRGARVRAIAYLREPQSFLCSVLQQRLRSNGQTLRDPGLAVDYRRRLGGWVQALPHGDIDLVQFHPTHLNTGDLLSDFSARIGVSPPTPRNHHANPALPAEAFAVLYAFRFARGNLLENPSQWQANQAVTQHLHSFGTSSLMLEDGFAKTLLKPMQEDIAWAESQLGGPFTALSHTKAAHFAMSGEAQLLDYADGLCDRLQQWLAQRWPDVDWPTSNVVEALDMLFAICAKDVLSAG